MRRLLFYALSFCWWFLSVFADETDPNDPGVDSDPYLQYKPEFARSLPVQILVTGVVLTLVAVLFIHIVFTAQYHWPLAPVNYILQLSGVITLLISLIATLHVVLSKTMSESERWPYMLSYIAVNVPPMDLDNDGDDATNPSWSLAERATWLIMNATVSGLVQITHIQFLTLLYPSRLEGRLIFSLLGPLAILAAVMQLIPINTELKSITVTSAIRNVCNATLSLLFTAALFLWGLLVNRRQAWRTDGGTAVFGVAALILAVVSTALNCLYVPRQEEYVWLPGLMWAVVLWQSFLGWWWWVGAGSGHTAEDVVEEVLRRGEKISRKRKERRRRARAGIENANGQNPNASSTAVDSVGINSRTSWRRNRSNQSSDGNHSGSEHELTTTFGTGSGESASITSATTTLHNPAGRRSTEEIGSVLTTTASRSSSSCSSGEARSIQPLPWFLPRALYVYYANLRQAHVTAARKQAVERVERIRELERERSNNKRKTGPGSGWGLGSFAWRIGSGAYSTRRDRDEDYEMGAKDARGRRRRRSRDSSSGTSGEEEEDVSGPSDGREPSPPQERQHPRPANSQSITSPFPPPGSDPPVAESGEENGRNRNSIWWWGPLRKWRLQDTTIY
ncbi:hypothetical protein K435DRAFT_961549 [Dendrothele bispora CBS 962.96]|uniref:PalH-domain-containing protein n=1 Tax=Dendrothele bispora (strain CBS 962.96) TaxID=1314807 RepID=A0A4S8MQJ9_DENBC|nr:hypothetical protein K435DRAFT_961549 [Dendrothele bispora CBS 962.96]